MIQEYSDDAFHRIGLVAWCSGGDEWKFPEHSLVCVCACVCGDSTVHDGENVYTLSNTLHYYAV